MHSVRTESVNPAPNHTGTFVDVRDAEILLHQYSEWLDSEGINPSTPDTVDGRTHDDLVKAFLAQRNPNAIPYLGDPR